MTTSFSVQSPLGTLVSTLNHDGQVVQELLFSRAGSKAKPGLLGFTFGGRRSQRMTFIPNVDTCPVMSPAQKAGWGTMRPVSRELFHPPCFPSQTCCHPLNT